MHIVIKNYDFKLNLINNIIIYLITNIFYIIFYNMILHFTFTLPLQFFSSVKYPFLFGSSFIISIIIVNCLCKSLDYIYFLMDTRR